MYSVQDFYFDFYLFLTIELELNFKNIKCYCAAVNIIFYVMILQRKYTNIELRTVYTSKC